MRLTTLTTGAALAALLALPAAAEVTVLGWPGGPEETALRAVADLYNGRPETTEENRVELLFTNRDGFFDKLQVDLAAGTDAFDVNLIATYSIGRYAPFMEPITLPDEAEAVFGDTVLSTMQYDGQQYGVPTDLSLHFLYVRSDLIDELMADDAAKATYAEIAERYLGEALEPKPPEDWTWEDFAATALYFTQSVNPDSPTRYGTVIQMKNLLFNMMVFHSWPRSYGADWMDEAGNITVDSPAYRETLEMAKMLYDAGATPADSTSYEYAEANAAWNSGQVATMVQWNAAASELTQNQPATESSRAAEGTRGPVHPHSRAGPWPERRIGQQGGGDGLSAVAGDRGGRARLCPGRRRTWPDQRHGGAARRRASGSRAGRRLCVELRLCHARGDVGQRAVGLRVAGGRVHRLLGRQPDAGRGDGSGPERHGRSAEVTQTGGRRRCCRPCLAGGKAT